MVLSVQKEALTKLKADMVNANTVGQLVALIIDNTHEEMLQVYNNLAPEQQAKIQRIWGSSGWN